MGLATQISTGTTAAVVGLTLSILCLAPHNWTDRTVAQAVITKGTDDESDSRPDIPAVARPEYLKEILPPVIHGLAVQEQLSVQDVDGSKGEYKLIAWSQWAPTLHSRIEFVAVKRGTKARRIWQSEDEELYEPRIRAVPDWKYHGHQIFLVLRQAGAAWEVAEPIWIEKDSVRQLPTKSCDYFEIRELKARPSQAHQLVGYSRPVGSFEMPVIYDWNGDDFIVNDSYPEFYKKLADENKDLFTDKKCDVSELFSEAVLLDKAGCKKEALALLKRIHKDVEINEDPELITEYHQLLSRLKKG